MEPLDYEEKITESPTRITPNQGKLLASRGQPIRPVVESDQFQVV